MDLFRRLFSKSRPAPAEASTRPAASGAPEGVSAVESASVELEQWDEATTKPIAPPVVQPMDGVTRTLPPETVISSLNEHIVFGQTSDIGQERANNQDSALSFFATSRSAEQRPDFGLFMVSDGMGGHSDGEKASALTVRTVASFVTNEVYLPMLMGNGSDHRMSISKALAAAVQKANTEVIAQVPEGGTTLSAIAIEGELAHIVHVGDSRIYFITKDAIEQVTRDHSLVQRLVELDQISPNETVDHPQKNVLYRAIGQNETVEVDTLTRRLTPHCRILLCSDGLWGQVKEDEIHDIVMGHANPQEACDKLVALANTRGGMDNITTILLKIPGS